MNWHSLHRSPADDSSRPKIEWKEIVKREVFRLAWFFVAHPELLTPLHSHCITPLKLNFSAYSFFTPLHLQWPIGFSQPILFCHCQRSSLLQLFTNHPCSPPTLLSSPDFSCQLPSVHIYHWSLPSSCWHLHFISSIALSLSAHSIRFFTLTDHCQYVNSYGIVDSKRYCWYGRVHYAGLPCSWKRTECNLGIFGGTHIGN